MAETPSKRLRQDTHAAETFDLDDSNSNSKRQKPYNNILSLLDEEDENEEQNQNLSAIFTTLEKELSFSSSTATAFDYETPPLMAEDGRQQPAEEDGVKSVMRHLLEASDDELGIPNCMEEENNNVELKSDENNSLNSFDNGLWEFEDVAANYYAILQSELFM